MRTLFCIANLNARRFRTNARHLSNLKAHFPTEGRLFPTRTLEEAGQALDSAASQRPDTVMICGGDGTLQATLDGLSKRYQGVDLPEILVVPAGTMNVVFHHYRKAPRLKRLDFRSIFEAWANGGGRLEPLPTLTFNGKIGFIFAIGGFSSFIEWYRESPDPTPWRGASLVLRTGISAILGTDLASGLFPTFCASFDQGVPSDDGTYVSWSASSISHIGFGARPYVDADEVRLGAFWMRAPLRGVAAIAPSLFLGRRPRSSACAQFPIERTVLRTEVPMKPMVDGEIFPAEKTFTLERGPVWKVRLC